MQPAHEPGPDRLREELGLRPECRFLDPQDFRSLLVSKQQLVRADEPRARLRGLMDPITRARYLVEEERLFNAAG